jgi:AcrR family transcriptional regulator
MALYWHVSNKDELLAAMGDRLYADLAIEVDPTTPWQDQLRDLADALLRSIQAHPRLAPLAGARVLANENGRRLTETALELLRSAGFSVSQSAAISKHVLLYTLALVIEQDDQASRLAAGDHDALLREKHQILAALPPDAYPNLVAAVDDFTSCDDEAGYYAYSLDLLMAGIEHLAPRPRVPARNAASRAR